MDNRHADTVSEIERILNGASRKKADSATAQAVPSPKEPVILLDEEETDRWSLLRRRENRADIPVAETQEEQTMPTTEVAEADEDIRIYRPSESGHTVPKEPVILLDEKEETRRWSLRRRRGNRGDVPSVETREEKTAPVLEAEETASPEADEDIRIYRPAENGHTVSQEAESGAVRPHTPASGRLSEREAATRVVELTPPSSDPEPSVAESPAAESDDLLAGQLTFEALEQIEETADKPETADDLEARVRDIRREKVESFQLVTGGKTDGFRLSGEEEENDPAEEPEQLVEEELEDYGSYEETEIVRSELVYRRRLGMAGLLFSGLMELILVSITVMVQVSGVFPMNAALYLTSHLLVLGLMMLIHHRVIGDGFASLFRLRATADSAAALASSAALLHTVLQFLNMAEVDSGLSPVFCAAAGLGLFGCALGRQYRASRICRNFRFVSHDSRKYAVQRVTDSAAAEQLGRTSVMMGEPSVAYARPAGFLGGFLESSYDEDGGDDFLRRYVPLALVASLAAAVAYGFLGGERANWWRAIAVFTASLCMSLPAFAAVGANLPLYRTVRRLLRRGAMLTGWQAVEEFGDASGMAVDASDLFPEETIRLHGIKTFSGARIDEAILDAAAVSIQAGGPLAVVFRRVIENRVDMLQDVDTLLYEQEMGLSGWVGGRRVLVGNRRLLENHGVDVPSRDYELRYTKDNRRLVYLSTGGELSAMFVVSYMADARIAEALAPLGEEGITLLVRTCDPNITRELICSCFGLDEYYVDILDVAAGRTYERLAGETAETLPALLATNGRVEGMAAALTACRRVRPKVTRSAVAQIVAGGCGLLLSAFAALYTGFALPPAYQLGYLAASSLLSLALCLFGKK